MADTDTVQELGFYTPYDPSEVAEKIQAFSEDPKFVKLLMSETPKAKTPENAASLYRMVMTSYFDYVNKGESPPPHIQEMHDKFSKLENAVQEKAPPPPPPPPPPPAGLAPSTIPLIGTYGLKAPTEQEKEIKQRGNRAAAAVGAAPDVDIKPVQVVTANGAVSTTQAPVDEQGVPTSIAATPEQLAAGAPQPPPDSIRRYEETKTSGPSPAAITTLSSIMKDAVGRSKTATTAAHDQEANVKFANAQFQEASADAYSSAKTASDEMKEVSKGVAYIGGSMKALTEVNQAKERKLQEMQERVRRSEYYMQYPDAPMADIDSYLDQKQNLQMLQQRIKDEIDATGKDMAQYAADTALGPAQTGEAGASPEAMDVMAGGPAKITELRKKLEEASVEEAKLDAEMAKKGGQPGGVKEPSTAERIGNIAQNVAIAIGDVLHSAAAGMLGQVPTSETMLTKHLKRQAAEVQQAAMLRKEAYAERAGVNETALRRLNEIRDQYQDETSQKLAILGALQQTALSQVGMYAQIAKTDQDKQAIAGLGAKLSNEIAISYSQLANREAELAGNMAVKQSELSLRREAMEMNAAGKPKELSDAMVKAVSDIDSAALTTKHMFDTINVMQGKYGALKGPKKWVPFSSERAFSSYIDMLALSLTREMNGGRPSDKDYQAVRPAMPSLGDTLEVVEAKKQWLMGYYADKKKVLTSNLRLAGRVVNTADYTKEEEVDQSNMAFEPAPQE